MKRTQQRAAAPRRPIGYNLPRNVRKRRETQQRATRHATAEAIRQQRVNTTPQPTLTSSLHELVLNPCGGKLVNGLYGTSSGMMARLRTDIALPTNAAATCGYFFWDPTYHCDPATAVFALDQAHFVDGAEASGRDKHVNAFCFQSDDPSVSPLNTAAFRFGFGASTPAVPGTNTAFGVRDPASALLLESMVADARTHAGCLTLQYTGKQDDIQGNWIPLVGVSISNLLTGASGGFPLSVNEVFALYDASLKSPATIVTEGSDIIYRPGKHSATFQNETQGVLSADNAGALVPLGDGSPKGGATEGLIGFAWRNFPATAGTLAVRLTKVIEWEAKIGVGMQREVVIHGPDASEAIGSRVPRGQALGQKMSHFVAAGLGDIGQALAGHVRRAGERAGEHVLRNAGEAGQDIIARAMGQLRLN